MNDGEKIQPKRKRKRGKTGTFPFGQTRCSDNHGFDWLLLRLLPWHGELRLESRANDGQFRFASSRIIAMRG